MDDNQSHEGSKPTKTASLKDMDKTTDVESTRDVLDGETARVIDTQSERALCRKLDFRLLPVLATMVCKVPSDKDLGPPPSWCRFYVSTTDPGRL